MISNYQHSICPHLEWSPISFSSHWMMVPSQYKTFNCSIYSWQKHQMEYAFLQHITLLENSRLFHCLQSVVKYTKHYKTRPSTDVWYADYELKIQPDLWTLPLVARPQRFLPQGQCEPLMATGIPLLQWEIGLLLYYSCYYSGRKAPSWGFASVLFRVFFSGRSCSARALCECWAHVPRGSTSFPVPSARQGPNWRAGVTGVDVLCLFYFCTYMCSRFVQYIYTLRCF